MGTATAAFAAVAAAVNPITRLDEVYDRAVTMRAPRLASRSLGPAVILALAAALGVLWAVAKPAGVPTASYVGQWFGAESILLMSMALVLISTLPWVEVWFDGIDRAAIWHRRLAITGLTLLLPHLLLAQAEPGHDGPGGAIGIVAVTGLVVLVVWAIIPRWQSVVPRVARPLILAAHDAPLMREFRRVLGGYERWRALHRTTGLFVAAGFAHGVLDGTPFGDSPVLRWSFVAIGATGVAFYVYRELLARFFLSLHDYQVAGVAPIADDLTEITLKPLGRPMTFSPGQFAMIYLEGKDGWHRHPFTIASAPHEETVRVTVKALGDYTSRLRETIEPGMPAVIGGPHGRFIHNRGTDRQIWIAGGVGIAPFLSWIRAIDHTPIRQVDLFYSNDGSPPFGDELSAAARDHPGLTVHLIDTSSHGRLTTDQVLQLTGADPRSLSVFMCGPAPMLRTFQTGLRAAGVPVRHIHREYFDWR